MGGSMARHAGPARRVRARARAQHADLGDGDRRQRDRRRDPGHAPDRRDHVRGLPHALDGAAREPGRQAPDDVGRPDEGAAHDPHAGRRGLVAGRAARPAARGVVRPRARAEGGVRLDPEDVRGLLWSAIYDDNPVVFFEHRTLYPIKGEVPGRARADPAREGAHPSRGRGRHRRRDGPARPRGAEGGGGGREGRHLGRGRRPADAAAARRGDDRRLGQEDDALRDRARGGDARGIRRRARGRRSSTSAFDWLDAPIERVGAKFAPLAVRAGDGAVGRPARRRRPRRDPPDGRQE